LIERIEENIYPIVDVKLSRRILRTNGELDDCSGFILKINKD
jgi:hypothetical protein